MIDEFTAGKLSLEVVTALERRREAIAGDEALTRAELERALTPLRAAYQDSALPASYFSALEDELRRTILERWRAGAVSFTALERSGFGSWRGGDVYARVVYVLAGLVVGGLCVALPFIPIWEKWFPFAVSAAGWFLPDVQAAWHRRRYARRLGEIVRTMTARQPALEAGVSWQELAGEPPKEQP
jgi:hypothetical protein